MSSSRHVPVQYYQSYRRKSNLLKRCKRENQNRFLAPKFSWCVAPTMRQYYQSYQRKNNLLKRCKSENCYCDEINPSYDRPTCCHARTTSPPKCPPLSCRPSAHIKLFFRLFEATSPSDVRGSFCFRDEFSTTCLLSSSTDDQCARMCAASEHFKRATWRNVLAWRNSPISCYIFCIIG